MNYRTAERRWQTMSIVRWRDHDCRIVDLSYKKRSANLHIMADSMSDAQVATNVPIKELRE